jgi:hypothetical protein
LRTALYSNQVFNVEYADIVQAFVTVSRNGGFAGDAVSGRVVVVPPNPGPMAHQFALRERADIAGHDPTDRLSRRDLTASGWFKVFRSYGLVHLAV